MDPPPCNSDYKIVRIILGSSYIPTIPLTGGGHPKVLYTWLTSLLVPALLEAGAQKDRSRFHECCDAGQYCLSCWPVCSILQTSIGFPKIRGTIWAMICWGPLIVGNYHLCTDFAGPP